MTAIPNDVGTKHISLKAWEVIRAEADGELVEIRVRRGGTAHLSIITAKKHKVERNGG